MKKKKSWDKKWYTEEFLNELKQTQYTEMCGSLPITVKYAPDAVSPLGIDPRLLGGPMGKTAKSMRLLPEFVIKRIKIKFNEKMLRKKFPLLYGEKFPFCSGVFQNSLHLVYI